MKSMIKQLKKEPKPNPQVSVLPKLKFPKHLQDILDRKVARVRGEPVGITLDYETSPMLGWFFGPLWETGIIKLVKPFQILSVGWMEHGSEKVYVLGQNHFPSYKKGELDDYEICVFFSHVLNKYDYIVAQNGDQFDIKVFNTRLSFWGLPPISTEKSFDTKKIAKTKLRLPSNKLNDIAEFFGFGQKIQTDKELWFGCMAGDEAAWKKMNEYCKHDVFLTDQIFSRLLPFTTQLNTYMRMNHTDINCSNVDCLSENLVPSKKRKVVNGWRWQYQCLDCGKYTTDTKLIKE